MCFYNSLLYAKGRLHFVLIVSALEVEQSNATLYIAFVDWNKRDSPDKFE